jgi:hypothetical protein
MSDTAERLLDRMTAEQRAEHIAWLCQFEREAERRVWREIGKQIRYRNDDPSHYHHTWDDLADWCERQAQQAASRRGDE